MIRKAVVELLGVRLGEAKTNRGARDSRGETAFEMTLKVYRQIEMPLADAYRYTSEVMVENMLARDAEEGIGAFIDKREPKWKDR